MSWMRPGFKRLNLPKNQHFDVSNISARSYVRNIRIDCLQAGSKVAIIRYDLRKLIRIFSTENQQKNKTKKLIKNECIQIRFKLFISWTCDLGKVIDYAFKSRDHCKFCLNRAMNNWHLPFSRSICPSFYFWSFLCYGLFGQHLSEMCESRLRCKEEACFILPRNIIRQEEQIYSCCQLWCMHCRQHPGVLARKPRRFAAKAIHYATSVIGIFIFNSTRANFSWWKMTRSPLLWQTVILWS